MEEYESDLLTLLTSLRIRMKSKALRTPTNWLLEVSKVGAVGMP